MALLTERAERYRRWRAENFPLLLIVPQKCLEKVPPVCVRRRRDSKVGACLPFSPREQVNFANFWKLTAALIDAYDSSLMLRTCNILTSSQTVEY